MSDEVGSPKTLLEHAEKEMETLDLTIATALIFCYIAKKPDPKQARRGCLLALKELPLALHARLFPAVLNQAKLAMTMKLS